MLDKWAAALPQTQTHVFPRRSAANSGVCLRSGAWLDSPPAGPGINPGEVDFCICGGRTAVAPVILTSSDRFAATSSIKEEEGV